MRGVNERKKPQLVCSLIFRFQWKVKTLAFSPRLPFLIYQAFLRGSFKPFDIFLPSLIFLMFFLVIFFHILLSLPPFLLLILLILMLHLVIYYFFLLFLVLLILLILFSTYAVCLFLVYFCVFIHCIFIYFCLFAFSHRFFFPSSSLPTRKGFWKRRKLQISKS